MKLLLLLVFSTCALSYNIDRNRIVGGNYASAGQFPYQTSQLVNERHVCGGSIINENTILTASHCVDGLDPWSIHIVVGALTVDDGTWYLVLHYVMHEDYNKVTAVNDIAVIKLLTSFEYMWTIQPIDVDSNYINTGAKSVTAGWGFTSWPSQNPSRDLLYLEGTIYDLERCKADFEGDKYSVLDSHICNFAKYGHGGCRGDCGGGLVVNGKHVGIASWVSRCANGYPDVFTRTSSYIDWINRQ